MLRRWRSRKGQNARKRQRKGTRTIQLQKTNGNEHEIESKTACSHECIKSHDAHDTIQTRETTEKENEEGKRKKKSRRIKQRENAKKKQKAMKMLKMKDELPSTIMATNKTIKIHQNRMENYCNDNFGFKPNILMPVWKNIKMVIGNMSLQEYHSHNANMACHDSCTLAPPPNNMAKLLGPGSKHCIQSRNINEKDFLTMLKRFACDVRRKSYVLDTHGVSDKPAPKLYVKNKTLEMRLSNSTIEGGIRKFKAKMRSLFDANKRKPKGTNITKLQENTLHYFQNHQEFTVLLADKNLGPCVMNREDCINQCVLQHLSNSECYERTSKEVAEMHLKESVAEFLEFVKQPGLRIEHEHLKYLERAADEHDGISTFHCLPKVHKKKKEKETCLCHLDLQFRQQTQHSVP